MGGARAAARAAAAMAGAVTAERAGLVGRAGAEAVSVATAAA